MNKVAARSLEGKRSGRQHAMVRCTYIQAINVSTPDQSQHSAPALYPGLQQGGVPHMVSNSSKYRQPAPTMCDRVLRNNSRSSQHLVPRRTHSRRVSRAFFSLRLVLSNLEGVISFKALRYRYFPCTGVPPSLRIVPPAQSSSSRPEPLEDCP